MKDTHSLKTSNVYLFLVKKYILADSDLLSSIQSNFSGSNTLGTMKICFETGVVRANEC